MRCRSRRPARSCARICAADQDRPIRSAACAARACRYPSAAPATGMSSSPARPHNGSLVPAPGATTNWPTTVGGVPTRSNGAGAGGAGESGGGRTDGAGTGPAGAGAVGCQWVSGGRPWLCGARPLPNVVWGGSNAGAGELAAPDPPEATGPPGTVVFTGASTGGAAAPTTARLADASGVAARLADGPGDAVRPADSGSTAAERVAGDGFGTSSRPDPTRDDGAAPGPLAPPPRLLSVGRLLPRRSLSCFPLPDPPPWLPPRSALCPRSEPRESPGWAYATAAPDPLTRRNTDTTPAPAVRRGFIRTPFPSRQRRSTPPAKDSRTRTPSERAVRQERPQIVQRSAFSLILDVCPQPVEGAVPPLRKLRQVLAGVGEGRGPHPPDAFTAAALAAHQAR